MALKPGQEKCINTLDRPLAVAAGAGSGKTFTLTKRIVGALTSGYVDDIDQVLAITFTNKAAAELKSRIKSELRAAGLAAQALKVDEAWISTIHGMCARILRAHAVQLGIDPAFQVADGARLDAYLAESVDEVLAEAQAGDSGDALDALFSEYRAQGGASSVQAMLTRLVQAALANPRGTGAFVLPSRGQAPLVRLARMVDVLEARVQLAEAEKPSTSRDKWMDEARSALEDAGAVLQAGSDDAAGVLRVLARFKLPKTFGSKEYKAAQAEAAAQLAETVLDVRLGAAAAHAETLAQLAEHVVERFAQRKRAAGVLDNNDLLTCAACAIERNPDIAARYAGKFKLVMVDEFQDTDQAQVDMIKRLSGEGFNRLCVVGDAQQSIYRFRGADVAVYRRHLDAVRAANPDGIIELPDNFRSHADVLSFVDCVFGQPSMFGGSFMSLKPGRDEARVRRPIAAGQPRVTVQLTSRPWQGGAPGLARGLVARRVARAFAAYARQGHAAGEMAVLLGTMTHAQEYAQALRDEGLACVISGGSVFAHTLEAQTVLELARLAASPRDTQALFNVLASPLFGLTASDFVALSTDADGEDGVARRRDLDKGLAALERSGSWNGRPLSERLSCAVRVLAGMRRRVAGDSVAHAVSRVLEDSGWISRMEAHGAEGQAAAANAYKAVRMLDALEAAEPLGPAALARRFADTLASCKEAPGALSVAGGDFVRIMTVHASKGLEFPIVAVAEFKDPRAVAPKLITADLDGDIYVSLDLDRTLRSVGGLAEKTALSDVEAALIDPDDDEDALAELAARAQTPALRRAAMRAYDARGDAEEAKRLLYVAFTRAKEALVVASSSTYTQKNPQGIPKNVFASVVAALDPSSGGFAPGRSSCDFGGSAPAVLEHVQLSMDESGLQDQDGVLLDLLGGMPVHVRPEDGLFMVPTADDAPPPERFAMPFDRRGVFSYSSIAEASHEGDVLDRLADAFAVAADPPADGAAEYVDGQGRGVAGPDFWDGYGAMPPSVLDDGQEALPVAVQKAGDADKATDLGTAFHRLAQYAVAARTPEGALGTVPEERVAALERSCGLTAESKARLRAALGRWLASDVRAAMEAYGDLRAEAPFFVRIDEPRCRGGAIYLEGEIDLLGLSADGSHAQVVDYKTGGSPGEDDARLKRKHVLQAACYAYALLCRGVQAVDAVFVRVEQPCGGASEQPQTVRYRFESGGRPVLEQAIRDVYVSA